MVAPKKWIKKTLRLVGLYDNTHQLWERRPDLRMFCWNAGYRLVGALDKLRIPPTRLIYLATLSKEVAWFLRSGRMGHQSILHVLQRNELNIEKFESILDFGCGCGRIMRNWKQLNGPLIYGTDYNPDLIAWCRQFFGDFATFDKNELSPPLKYKNGKFDFIYAISVFTHLAKELQIAWMDELSRIIMPGGYLLITLHGASRFYQLSPEEQEQFQAGQLVVKQESLAGTNWCAAYHPESYVRRTLARTFDVVDFIPRGGRDTDQDIFLLRKPEGNDRVN